VQALFWDIPSRSLQWDQDRELIMSRILASGPWETVLWLRAEAGDEAIRSWIEQHEGKGLSPRQLRFWQLVLDLPASRVDQWLAKLDRKAWDQRTEPELT
jgi:hypothetical protein